MYRLYKYYYDESKEVFKPVLFTLDGKTCSAIHKEHKSGITSFSLFAKRQKTFNSNLTLIPMKSNYHILIDEVLSPFYVFQVQFSREMNDVLGFKLYLMVNRQL